MAGFDDPRPRISKADEQAATAKLSAHCEKRHLLLIRAGHRGSNDHFFNAEVEVPDSFTFSELNILSSEMTTILNACIPTTNIADEPGWGVSFVTKDLVVGRVRGGYLDEIGGKSEEREMSTMGLERPSGRFKPPTNVLVEIANVVEDDSVVRTQPVLAALVAVSALCEAEGLSFDVGVDERDMFHVIIYLAEDDTINRAVNLKHEAVELMSKYISDPEMRGFGLWFVCIRCNNWNIYSDRNLGEISHCL